MPFALALDLSVNLGQLLTIASFVVTVIWAHSQMKARLDLFFSTLERHEKSISRHDERLQDHGEQLALVRGERRRANH